MTITLASSLGTGHLLYDNDENAVVVLKEIQRRPDAVVSKLALFDENAHEVALDQKCPKCFSRDCELHSLNSAASETIKSNSIGTSNESAGWNNESVNRTAALWDLSTDECANLIELGHRLQDVGNYSKNNPADVVRFFIANSGDLDRAEKQFRKMVSWRKQHDVDRILHFYQPPTDLVNHYPGAVLQGLDKVGDPIFVSRVGVTDAAGMLRRYGHDEMIKHAIWLRELLCTGPWIQQHEQTNNRPVKCAIVIEDVDQLQLLNIIYNRPLLSLYAEIMRLDQDNYPEAAKKIFILRAPVLFRLVWNIVQHFFDANVREKMMFTSQSNYMQVLAEYVDLSVLPHCIVPDIGKGKPLDGMPPNFEGGPLPPTF
jgi:CRAL/TRIO domain